jgi:hypothetical protein
MKERTQKEGKGQAETQTGGHKYREMTVLGQTETQGGRAAVSVGRRKIPDG